MQNNQLAKDYLKRSKVRLLSIEVLFQGESWADVVRESQEVVELSLKALLRSFHIEFPRIHDVSGILEEEITRFDKELAKKIPVLSKISKQLRRDRELSFYGSEDLTPSDFYNKEDALDAFSKAKLVVETITPYIK